MKKLIQIITILTAVIMLQISCSGGGSSSGGGSEGDTASSLTEADMPTEVSAFSAAASTVTVSWAGNKNDGRYKVVLSTSADYADSVSFIKTVDPATSALDVAGVNLNEVYVFVISMFTDGSEGTAVAANEGAPVLVSNSTGNGTNVQGNGSGTTAQDSTNETGASQGTDTSGETSHVQSDPDIPSAVIASATGDGQVTVSWEGENYDGVYHVVVDDDSSYDDDAVLLERSGTSSPTVINGLQTGDYYVWVTAFDSDDNELFRTEAQAGSSIAVVNPATDPADEPGSVHAEIPAGSLAKGELLVSWSGDVNGGSYKVVIDDDYDYSNDTPVQIESGVSSPLVVNGLSSASYYTWVIPVAPDGTEGDPVAADGGSALIVYSGSIAAANDSASVYAGKSTVISAALLLGNDANNMTDDPLEIIEVKNSLGGSAVLADGLVTFTSEGEAGEEAGFSYVARIKDNPLFTVEGFVAVTVNPAPDVIANSDTSTVRQGEEIYLSIASLMANDEGNNLTFIDVANPVNGTLLQVDDNITFTSTGLAYQVAQFEYIIEDDIGTRATGTVVISVDPLPEVEAFVYEDIDTFNEQKTVYAPPTMNTVFNSWGRFDGNNFFADKNAAGITANANAWEFLSDPTRVSMPRNVTPYNGFVSPQELEDFTFEATVTSPHNDNDNIGLVIAYVRIDNINYSLTAVRTRGGMEPKDGWGIMYNVEDGPTHGNSGLGGRIIEQKVIGTKTTANWSGVTSRIKVVRSGDLITCYATDWNDTANYDASSKIEVNLADDPDLVKFRGAKPYGYMSFSQPNSTYLDINFDGGLDTSTMMFIDWDTGTVQVWTYNVDHWDITTKSIQEVLGYVRIVTNPVTGKRYLIKENSIELIE